ncbi:hypothetical protein SOVF_004700 [Spinacia oleracea]|nr:hypothetical protein SOVF_004700 [Spinacia oleracea]
MNKQLSDYIDIKRERWVLTVEGRLYAIAGSPEMQVDSAIPQESISPDELQRKVDPYAFMIGFRYSTTTTIKTKQIMKSDSEKREQN